MQEYGEDVQLNPIRRIRTTKDTVLQTKCSDCPETFVHQCATCNSPCCPRHFWTDQCYRCLKESMISNFFLDYKQTAERLSNEINTQFSEKSVTKLKIKQDNSRIAQLESSLKKCTPTTLESLKKKIEQTVRINKTLTVSAEGLKKALTQLSQSENLVVCEYDKNDGSVCASLDEILILQTDELTLLNTIDDLKRQSLSSLPYHILRSIACAPCTNKIKHKFQTELSNFLSKNDSILASILSHSPGYPQGVRRDSCNCHIM